MKNEKSSFFTFSDIDEGREWWYTLVLLMRDESNGWNGGNVVAKKVYIRPVLKTEEVKLGVFGNYQDVRPSGKREPLTPISDLDLRIE